MNKYLKNLIKISISLIIIFYLFSNINLNEVLSPLKEINIYYLFFAFLLCFLSLLIMTFKWHLILKKYIDIGKKNLFKIYWASDFINLFGLGSVGGEIYKMISLNDKKKALASSLFDKLLSFYWYILLGVSTLISSCIFKSIPLVLFFGIIFYLVLIFITLQINLKRKNIIQIIPSKKISNFLNKINLTSYDLILHSFLSFLFIINSALIYSLVFISTGLGFKFIELIIFVPILTIATSLPISFEGLGVREYLFVELSKIILVNTELILLSSLIIGFIGLAYRLSGSISFIFFRNKH